MHSNEWPKKGRGGRRAGAGRKQRLCPVKAPKGPRGGKRPGAGRPLGSRKHSSSADQLSLELFG